MRFFWEIIKVSIAGAKLSHLVQKDRIWDHGSMIEHARIVFHLVQKARSNGNIESVRKYMTTPCFEALKRRFDDPRKFRITIRDHNVQNESAVITELAVISVQPGKNGKPDMFSAVIKGNRGHEGKLSQPFSLRWFFVRQGDWWLLKCIQ